VQAPDGGRQWSYKGGLVYTFNHDERPGDAFGEHFAGMESPWSPILRASLILSGP
jgi:predicted lipoprotein with Yx(FWY)xxD motif